MRIKGAGKGGQEGVSKIEGGISGLGTKNFLDTNTFSFSDFFLPSLFSLTGQEATVSIVHSSEFIVHSSESIVHSSEFIVHSSESIVHSSEFVVHNSESIVQSSIEGLEYKPGDFRTQLFDFVNSRNNHHDTVLFLRQARFHSLTNLSQNFGQFWLRPIIDFSLPPDVAYNHIPAWELLNGTEELKNSRLDQQIAIIAPCGYDEAGITPGSDNFPVPLAVAYWRERLGLTSNSSGKFTGSEVHAYMIHHLLTQRLVIPIPHLWAIALAGLLGKGVTLVLEKHYRQRQLWVLSLTGATAIYGLVGLQVYITAEVLLPWLLPSATFLIYVWFFSRNNS